MDYGRSDRAERLAAEYALGTLRGGARRRFERLLPAHPALRAALLAWQRRLQPLAAPVEPVAPPERVWQAVQRRLFPEAAPVPWWRGLAFWRVLSAASLAGLLVMTTLPRSDLEQAPLVIVLAATPEGAAFTGQGFVASVMPDGGTLVLKPLAPVRLEAGRALELWSVPASGAPRSLGLLRGGNAATTVMLRAQLLGSTTAFAVSLEPAGGSPSGQPTGPIVSVGKI